MNGNHHALNKWLSSRMSARHRAMIVLAGNREASITCARAILESFNPASSLTLSDHPRAPHPNLHMPKAAQLIGLELDAVVVDIHAGLDADTLGAVSGTVRGGGLLMLCCPPLAEWPRFNDPCKARFAVFPGSAQDVSGRFLARLSSILSASDAAWVQDPSRLDVSAIVWRDKTHSLLPQEAGETRLTEDQRIAVQAVCHVVSGQRRRPVVLNADRGRGKSAALGVAAATLLKQRACRILVCAVSRGAVEVVFRHVRATLERVDDATRKSGKRDTRITHGDGVIEFIEPSRLLGYSGDVDLVLVDEAAALPLHWLEQVLKRFSRVAFATTVHGYEGSGRGFATRFEVLLNTHSRGWRRVTLAEPVRWERNDPLESLVFDALLLNARAAKLKVKGRHASTTARYEWLDRDVFARDETGLRQFFGLLVESHYRTRPNDLRYLLDGPNLELLVARENGIVVGAAVLSREGGFDANAADDLWNGRSRPRGHMLAETMSAQLSEREWPTLRGYRVVRVAVHAECRRSGIGSGMLSRVVEQAREGNLDYIGASFAVGSDVVRFWTANDFEPVWLSGRRNASSGVRSVLVVKPLNLKTARAVARAGRRFLEGFCTRLAGLYADEEAAHVALMFQGLRDIQGPSRDDIQHARRFSARTANFDSCFAALFRLAPNILSNPNAVALCNEQELSLLISLLLQQIEPSQAAKRHGLGGRQAALAALAELLERILPILAGEDDLDTDSSSRM
jgi:tRNA(Met) cytidine acetyltransferase